MCSHGFFKSVLLLRTEWSILTAFIAPDLLYQIGVKNDVIAYVRYYFINLGVNKSDPVLKELNKQLRIEERGEIDLVFMKTSFLAY